MFTRPFGRLASKPSAAIITSTWATLRATAAAPGNARATAADPVREALAAAGLTPEQIDKALAAGAQPQATNPAGTRWRANVRGLLSLTNLKASHMRCLLAQPQSVIDAAMQRGAR